VFPSNYPSEFFYQIADSDLISTPGCNGTTPGFALLRMALEGSFANGVPEPGQQIVFARIRIKVTSGLCPNTSYTFTTPYGPVGPFLTNTDGGIPANAGTVDIDPALTSIVLTNGLLRWDPAYAPAPLPPPATWVTLSACTASSVRATSLRAKPNPPTTSPLTALPCAPTSSSSPVNWRVPSSARPLPSTSATWMC
jgi:hypothetical protein